MASCLTGRMSCAPLEPEEKSAAQHADQHNTGNPKVPEIAYEVTCIFEVHLISLTILLGRHDGR
jgi:hypothetical protein